MHVTDQEHRGTAYGQSSTPTLTTPAESMTTDSAKAITSFASSTAQSDCPTVTLTNNVCKTYATPDCVLVQPVTRSCGCPSAVPTVFVDYPCDSGCGGIGCSSNYVFFAENCTDPSASSLSPEAPPSTTFANSTACWMGTGLNGTNTTTTRTTITGTSTAFVSASPSIAAARRMGPFWAVWIN